MTVLDFTPRPTDGGLTLPIQLELVRADRDRLLRAACAYFGVEPMELDPPRVMDFALAALRVGLDNIDTEATTAITRLVDRHTPQPFGPA